MQYNSFGLVCNRRTLLKLWVFLCMLFSAVQPQNTDDGTISPCELESIINQLTNPSPEYQLHVSALRNQLKNLIRSSQTPTTNQLNLDDYDFTEDDKRSIASLASIGQGYMNRPYMPKRSLATLAKNGQLPTPEPDEADFQTNRWQNKRYLGALARGGGVRFNGKRNIGALARDYQLPGNGKRNLATMARLGLLSPGNMAYNPKRNLASIARYNSGFRGAAEKRNLGALKGSPVHGNHQKKDTTEQEALADLIQRDIMDYAEQPNELYPSYDDYTDNMEKRFLGFGQLESIDNNDAAEIDDSASSEQSALSSSSSSASSSPAESSSSSTMTAPISTSKRHIGALARSGWLPAGFRSVRSGRFSRSGRARQIVEYYPQPELLRQPTAAVCRRCYLPYKPIVSWGGHGYQTTTWGTPPRVTQYRRSFRQPATYRF
ncbi:neuropeptide-like 1 isoform X2 [Episyrphus balteatus]|uniref:neuropeptide-like 1 isoform X2 n=1 Tax=Episyrphus balteatus TaxID=286459 RepID=UPI00248569D2|nr:neuropeptide-like 1 isoform X2 [Episyrphus balteatus]